MTIDVARLIGALTRGISTREFQGKPAQVLLASRTFDTSCEDLWDALTNVERIPRWFLPVSGDLQLGGRYQLEGNASGEITACEAPRHLALTWEFGGELSWVDVRLQKADNGTELHLEHIAHVPEEFWDQYGPGATGVGWEQALLGLELHLTDGPRPDDVETWVASADGKDFIARSSEGWCKASIADGTDEASAREAAERTTRFYTGTTGEEE